MQTSVVRFYIKKIWGLIVGLRHQHSHCMILLVELNNLKKNIMAQCVKCGNDVKPEEKQRLSTFFWQSLFLYYNVSSGYIYIGEDDSWPRRRT